MFGATRKKLATSSVGPKQKACLAKGGSWEGPVGKKTCVMPVDAKSACEAAGHYWAAAFGACVKRGSGFPGADVLPAGPASIAVVGADGYPKPGTTNYGPAPAPPPGGWPAFKGAPGPKQKTCTASGGSWIGPTGKKWCQMPQAGASAITPTQVAPDTQTNDTVSAVDAKIFDSGGYPGSASVLTPDGASMDNQAIPDIQRAGGPVSASASATAPFGGSSWGTPLLVVAGGVALYFLLKKTPKAAKVGTKRTTRSRTTRRRTR